MNYTHKFRVTAPLSKVADFHRRSSSMAAITPPPLKVNLHTAPDLQKDGDRILFTLRLGLIPINWEASIENVSPNGFTDRQLNGPFREWVHQHKFIPINEQVTEVSDKVAFKIRPHLIWGPVGLGMWISLPFLFAYRGWKTRRILENKN